MTPTILIRRGLAALVTLLMAACVAYPVEPYPPGPSAFDRSWEAALGAAADTGVQVLTADRASGRIAGTRAGAAVRIDVQTRADGRVQVAFDAPASTPGSPALADQLSQAYNRRMGR